MLLSKKIKFVGISLASIGVNIGMYLNYFYPIIKWSPIVMMLSFVLTANWKNILNLRFPLMNGWLKVIILTQIIYLLYGVYDGKIDFQYISFFLYVIAFSLALASNDFLTSFVKFPGYLFSISLIPLFLGIYVCFNNLVVGDFAWSLKYEQDDYSLEPFTVSQGALCNILSGLCLKKDKMFPKILFVLSIIAGTYVILSCGKRTPYFVFLICFIYYIYVKQKINNYSSSMFIMVILGVIILWEIAYLYVPFFYEHINRFGNNMIAGIYNLFGDTSIYDETGSAYIRVENRMRSYNYVEENFTPFNYLFGGGYNCIGQIDNPLLQSYIEIGVLGVCLYTYIIFFIPITIARKYINDNSLILALLLNVYSIVSALNSGNPYMYSKYVPVCLLIIVFYSIYNKRLYNNSSK